MSEMPYREYDTAEIRRRINDVIKDKLDSHEDIYRVMRELRKECIASGHRLCVVIPVDDDELIDRSWGELRREVVPSMYVIELADRVLMRSNLRERFIKDRDGNRDVVRPLGTLTE